MRLRLAFILALILTASSVAGQPLFNHGDVIVSTFEPTGDFTFLSKLLVYSGPGDVQQIGSSESDNYRETLVRDSVLFVATRNGIDRINTSGQMLTKFTTVTRTTYMAPASDGGIVASNQSGQIYRFNPDGSIRVFQDNAGARGVDLAPDQCTVFHASVVRLARWDSCLNTPPVLFGSPGPGPLGNSFRLLPDGSFIAAYLQDIAHYDSSGQIIRVYGIPGDAVALDVDGTSFWASAGGTLVKADIATGAILHSEFLNAGSIDYLSVVGEPRAALSPDANIPTTSTVVLTVLVLTLAAVAIVRLR